MTDIAIPVAAKAAPRIEDSDLVKQRVRAAMWFLLPMLTALAIVAAWPLMRTIWFSLTNASLTNLTDAKFIWFNNYLHWTVLKSGKVVWSGVLVDPAWWNAVWNTVRFAAVSVAFETVFGVIVALVLNAEFPGRGIVRAAVLVPWAIPTIVSARMWGWMFNDQFGIINDMLMHLGLISTKIAWTASADTAFYAILIVDIWKTTPFMALLILAGLQLISKEVYEAAKVDGATPWQRFTQITIPLVKPAVMVALLFRTLDVLRMFDLPYIMTGGGAGDGNDTTTLSILVIQATREDFNEASALSTITFLFIFLVAFIFIKFLGADVSEEEAR